MMEKWDIPQFKLKSFPQNLVRNEWVKYKRNIDYIIAATGETDRTRIKNIFLAKAGPELQEIFTSIPGADVQEDPEKSIDPFAVAINKLDEYFSPKQHETFERNMFWTLKPETEETLGKFMLRCQDQAAKCNFGSNAEESRAISVVDKVILYAPSDLKEQLLQKDVLKLDDVTKIVSSYESVKQQAKSFSLPGTSFSSDTDCIPLSNVNKVKHMTNKGCTRCGRSGHFANDSACPARLKECIKCKRIGHFAAQCRSLPALKHKQFPKQESKWQGKRFKSHQVNEIGTSDDNESKNFLFSISDGGELIRIKLGGVVLQVLVDSGCKKNIVDEQSWNYIKANGAKIWNQTKNCDEVFLPYGENAKPLTLLGKFDATVSINDIGKIHETIATFYVAKGGQQCLLGRVTATDLGVLFIGLPSTHGVNAIKTTGVQPFPKIKGIQVKVPIDEFVQPVCQPPRRPPIALMTKIEDKLNSLLASDIIERVEGSSPWVSPLVTVVKDNGDLRLCVDMRRANMAIVRERHIMPTIEDFLPRFTSAKWFSRLDVKEAFHQVELENGSRYITTFITHMGLFRYKRLMYGIACAPELFQRILEQILSPFSKNVVNFIDDILIFASTEQEHDRVLDAVLSTLNKYGMLLNQGKCVFKVSELEFLGHVISPDGICPSNSKVECLQKFRAPSTSEEVRSFLGLVTYIGRFLPNLATITAPLRELTHSGVKFIWGEKQQTSFEKLKELIGNVQHLRFFDNTLRTRVIADASPVALGAVLLQFKGPTDDDPRPIAYASKSLTSTEKRYCQTEKEALALVWAVERFSVYLLGRKFELETDHKPLEAIFKPTSRPCSRIERWVLRLQSFSFVVKYRKGINNVADPFSRLVEEQPPKEFDAESKFMVLAVLESAAIDVQLLEERSSADATLGAVKQCLHTGNWDIQLVKPFTPFKNELGFIGDLVVRGNKLVVPDCLRQRMLDLAHEGHPGESVMKRRLRDRVWWPGMDRDAEKQVKACDGCRLVSLPNKPEPMSRREMPSKPWIEVAVDFLGPLPCGTYLLVIIDYYSRYKEVETMAKITAKETVERLDRIFSRLGYPQTITLDNAKQFVGTELDEYTKIKGITLRHSTPYWPQENGLVERQNRSLLKRLQISHALSRDWRRDLREYLLMYYTTPHSITGKTPTELLYGRTIRSKIPTLDDIETMPISSEARDRDLVLKDIGKQSEDMRRHARKYSLATGDTVLMQNLLPGNKLSTTFNPKEYVVMHRSGPRVTIEDPATGKSYDRNISHLKKVSENAEGLTETNPTSEEVNENHNNPSPEFLPESSNSDGEFNGFNIGLNQNDESNSLPKKRQQRATKKPSRFADYVP
ncbi:uncharacterized protein K02A2.6-like [Toxorhynchites rutilus septentrionalis]|uniref:uncharacterized protein K02A2.6-like n=1 Tax=Toxorhynchites rutilus septentrionalis TaxID=329112 RepID=UPI00247930D7|nr:uncharacterized protein K02A2.6-like [Toxorhynchites rutilus septentrionalis]XP_055615316.1 uncharacterized protein K02A2.6-like [Toxorhynchites rutilus septentrionalis]XP_055620824.1 uncharacterized protein K02A2.6-like [Toxorhynchites rutilus septentrionalis]